MGVTERKEVSGTQNVDLHCGIVVVVDESLPLLSCLLCHHVSAVKSRWKEDSAKEHGEPHKSFNDVGRE